MHNIICLMHIFRLLLLRLPFWYVGAFARVPERNLCRCFSLSRDKVTFMFNWTISVLFALYFDLFFLALVFDFLLCTSMNDALDGPSSY